MWGNGAATARVLARSGAIVFGCDINVDAAIHTQKRLQAEGADVTIVATDVTDDDSVKHMVDACIAKYGRIDVLVK
jgi:NAD(P)-dependent dehydrogenase (short-subunit alcohol dehydrogenase family)